MDRRADQLQRKLNPVDGPKDDVLNRTRTYMLSQMNRGELFWAGLQEGGGKEIPDVPPPLGNAPFEIADELRSPAKKKGKPQPRKKK